jgi:hypothetical protein
MDAWVGGLIASLVLAVVGFVLGGVQQNRQNEMAREEALRQNETAREEVLRQTRLDSYAALCSAIIEYRRAQLHRWFVGQDIGASDVVEQQRPEVADEVRRTRAAAWGQFYKVVMICNDDHLETLARDAMKLTKEMKFAPDAGELDRRSDEVHAAVERFAHQAGTTVRSLRQPDASPPPGWSRA